MVHGRDRRATVGASPEALVLPVVLIVAGLIALAWGSDQAVGGARTIARRLGVSPLVIGLTLTSIGTSLPEIATNLAAGIATRGGADASGIAVGNIVGSNLSQITLLMGIVGLAGPMVLPRRALLRDGGMVMVALLLMFGVVADGRATQVEAALLVASYVVYLVVVLVQERKHPSPETTGDTEPARASGISLAVRTGGGLTLVVAGAHLVVSNGVVVARAFGVDEAIVGLMVGLGTGLPELVVSLRALRSGAGAMSLGNLLGSNITDPLLSFGIGALVADVAVDPITLRLDFPMWILATAVALLALHDRLELTRTEAVTLLLLFVFWMYLRLGLAPTWALVA